MGLFSDWFDTLFRRRPQPPPVPAAPTPGSGTVSSAVVIALNNERAALGVYPPLAVDRGLTAIAASWAGHMAARGLLDHGGFVDRIASVHPNTAASENIAEGYPDVASVVAGWMNSPQHRANILGDFTHAGAGMATAANGDVYFCCDFDKP